MCRSRGKVTQFQMSGHAQIVAPVPFAGAGQRRVHRQAQRAIPGGGGLDRMRLQLMGTGLWDDPKIFADASLQGAWFAAPDPAGYRNFAGRYRAKFGQDPVRTATLAYDAVSLVAALVKTQGAQRFAPEVLANPSGFSGVDGIFRFRADGTNQRGLAVLRVAPGGPQVISPAPRAFSAGT